MATQDNQLGHAHHQITDLLNRFSTEEQCRLIQSIITLQGLNVGPTREVPESSAHKNSIGDSRDPVFSGHKDLSPKGFMAQKKPQTDIERVTCLAYYLTHYKGSKYFKTTDIRNLNVDAAQRGLTNTTATIKNAYRKGFLVPAPQKNCKQISAAGEEYVRALPDREQAKKVMEKPQQRRTRKKKSSISKA